jgi:hypothetical protein
MLKVASASKFPGAETLKREGCMDFLEILGGSYSSAKVEGLLVKDETW